MNIKLMMRISLLMCSLLVCLSQLAIAQTTIIKGTVKDKSSGIPLQGVTIVVKGKNQVVQTDVNGAYNISIADAQPVTLSFRYLGYTNLEQVVSASKTLNVELVGEENLLEEVVAIGYAKVKRKDLTGASSSVAAADLVLAPVTTAAQALTGKAAGVRVVTQSGAPGAPINITIRGGNSISQGTAPLYIVDGFQMDDALRTVDINDIEAIDVLKDASATAIYGARGSNGVVLITTKSAKLGKTVVNYNTYVGFEKLGSQLPVLNVLDYTKYQYEFQTLSGKQANWASYFGGNVDDPDFFTGAYDRINSE
uniref:carboxypeptidase-like regulatory domain-containing protein n=1 Tax=Pedobacter sp. TaxID=1411316 RepID=UPI003D7F366B